VDGQINGCAALYARMSQQKLPLARKGRFPSKYHVLYGAHLGMSRKDKQLEKTVTPSVSLR
jgi:hypothetical protein